MKHTHTQTYICNWKEKPNQITSQKKLNIFFISIYARTNKIFHCHRHHHQISGHFNFIFNLKFKKTKFSEKKSSSKIKNVDKTKKNPIIIIDNNGVCVCML